jgi:tetratricopeptide (TPR) repeat protein
VIRTATGLPAFRAGSKRYCCTAATAFLSRSLSSDRTTCTSRGRPRELTTSPINTVPLTLKSPAPVSTAMLPSVLSESPVALVAFCGMAGRSTSANPPRFAYNIKHEERSQRIVSVSYRACLHFATDSSAPTAKGPARVRLGVLFLALIGLGLVAQPASSQQQSPSPERGVRVSPGAVTAYNGERVQRRDYALLFATNEYDSWEPLVNPIKDADDISAELKDNYGFETEVLHNPTRERIVSKLREYAQKKFDDADQLFIFFAGHGLFDEVFGQGFIVARDSRRDDETRGTYESYDDLRAIINRISSKHILLLVDACYSGTFDRRLQEAGSRGSDSYSNLTFQELFRRKVNLQTRKYLTSGGKDYVPDGLPGHHSPFASHFLEELRTYGRGQGYLTFANILTAVERTNPEPRWGEWGNNEPGSDFFFVSTQLSAKLADSVAPSPASVEVTGRTTRGATNASPGARPSIAVLGFRNLSDRADDAWLSTALSEWLTTELAAGQSLRAIAGENADRVKQDLGLSESSGYARDTLSRIYKNLGSEYVVSGSYTSMSRQPQGAVRVDVRLQNAESGENIALPSETGSQADLPELVRKVGAQLRASLGVESVTETESRSVKAAFPSKPESSRAYAEGLQKLRAYDLLAARDFLQSAVAADPKSALARQALAQAWLELGYDSKAREEAANASDLSGNLSPERRMSIEASFRKMNAQWDRAIEIYRSLWTIYPDETDYALQLADVQTQAGKGKDALVTLEGLRVRSPEAANDPRVDLAEALAASSLSDFKRKQEAAARGADKASRLGARLLAAQSYWQDCSALLSLGDQKGAEEACVQASQAANSSAGRQVQARSATVLANIRVVQGRNSEALELRKQALGTAREIGSRKDILGALINLANLQQSQEQLDDAAGNYEEAIQLARDMDDKPYLVRAQLGKGNVLSQKADYKNAEQMWKQARQGATELGDMRNVANTSINLATMSLQLGDLSESERNVRQAIAVGQGSGLQRVYASSLSKLGDIQMARADLPGARKSYQDALDLFTKFEDQARIADSRLSLAGIALEEGDTNRAETLVRQAIAAFQSERTPDEEASAHETLARVLMAQGKRDQAMAEINNAQALAAQDNEVRIAVAVTGARLGALKGNAEEARQSLESSLVEARRLKLGSAQLDIRLALAEIELSSDAASARAELASLEQDARNSGYLLIAAKAAGLQRLR